MSAVDHPKHYNQGTIEPITFIEDQKLGFHLGNVVKYICRSKYKGNEYEDLLKALWYLERHIQNVEIEHDRSGNNKGNAINFSEVCRKIGEAEQFDTFR